MNANSNISFELKSWKKKKILQNFQVSVTEEYQTTNEISISDFYNMEVMSYHFLMTNVKLWQ